MPNTPKEVVIVQPTTSRRTIYASRAKKLMEAVIRSSRATLDVDRLDAVQSSNHGHVSDGLPDTESAVSTSDGRRMVEVEDLH